MVVVSTLLMAGIDLVPPALSGHESEQLALAGGAFNRRTVAGEFHGGGAIRIAVGTLAWIADHVSFRTSVDARLAHIVLAWVFAPATLYLVMGWVRRIETETLFGSAGLSKLFLPYAPVALIAAVGWITAWRASPPTLPAA